MNFNLPDGQTSRYGMQVADQLVEEFHNENQGIEPVDRSVVLSFLQKEQLTERSLSSDFGAVWLGLELDANVLIRGTAVKVGESEMDLSVKIISARDLKKTAGVRKTVRILGTKPDMEPYDPLNHLYVNAEGKTEGRTETTPTESQLAPKCFYMPNPAYPESARKSHVEGVAVILGLVQADGSVGHVHLLRVLDKSLADSTLNTVATWRCKSLTVDGKPIPTLVMFKVNFQMN
jgi:Gram-negative bacterial TonB protein C-terminal